MDEHGITLLTSAWYASLSELDKCRVISWDEVRWLRDCGRLSSRTRWVLEIVLKNGRVVWATASASRTPSAVPETLNAIRRAASDHGIPAVLTGRPVERGPAFGVPGLHPDPGGEPGLREWTGTEWSPVLHTDAGDPAGDGTGELAATWARLSKQVLQQYAENTASALESRRGGVRALRILTLITAALLLADLVIAVIWLVSPVTEAGGAVAAVWGVGLFLALCVGCLLRGIRRARHGVRRHQAMVEVAKAAVLRAGAQDVDSAPESTWIVRGRQNEELRLDDHEITVRTGRQTHWIAWDDVQWFRDGRHFHLSRRLRDDGCWELAIVLKDGSVVRPSATRRRTRDSAETITAVRQAASHHAIPVVLTGRPVTDKPSPADMPGLYPDPGGEPALREWTGTEWLPFLLIEPSEGCPSSEIGQSRIWSPLPKDEQQRQWDAAVAAVESRKMVVLHVVALQLGYGMFQYPPAIILAVHAAKNGWWLGLSPFAAVPLYVATLLWTCGWGVVSLLPVRNRRAAVKVARAARAASARAAIAAATPAEADMTVSASADAGGTPPVRRRRLLSLTAAAIILAVAAAVIAGILLDQRTGVADVAKRSGQAYKLSGELHDPSGQPVFSVVFSHDGRTVAVGDIGGTISLWNVASRHLAGVVSDPRSDGIYSAAFSPDGRMLVVGDGNGTTYLWNVTAMTLAARLTDRACDRVYFVGFSADGLSTMVACGNGRVYQWNTATSPATATLITTEANEIALAYSPDGRTMAGVDDAAQIYLGDMTTGNTTPVHFGVPADAFDSVAFSPDGSALAAGSMDGKIYLWNLSGHLIATRTDPDSAGVRSVAFSPDGRTIAAGDSNGTTYLWSAG